MSNPVLVEVLRGEHVESAHRGAVAVVDANGKALLEIGDIARPVFPRSAVKAIQALPLVESGAADALGFGDRELALACASHGGEPGMSRWRPPCWPAPAWTRGAGMRRALADRPRRDDRAGARRAVADGAAQQLFRQAFRLPLHLPAHRAWRIAAMSGSSIRIQATIREVMEDVTGAPHDAENSAHRRLLDPDLCGADQQPCARLRQDGDGRAAVGGAGEGGEAAVFRLHGRAVLRRRTGAADLSLMQAAPGRIFVKTGAEGVYCAAVPELGLGIALKCDDGAGRAAEAMIAAVLARLLRSDEALSARLDELARPAVPSRKGEPVGRIRPTEALPHRLQPGSAHMVALDREVGVAGISLDRHVGGNGVRPAIAEDRALAVPRKSHCRI